MKMIFHRSIIALSAILPLVLHYINALEGEICYDLACENGGVCKEQIIDNTVVQSCDCPPNFSGAFCEDTKHCPLPCGDHGVCHYQADWIGWEGDMLDENNEVMRPQIVCACHHGYKGNNCEEEDDHDFHDKEHESSHHCRNNKECVNNGHCVRETQYGESQAVEFCMCAPGFGGDMCEEKLNCDLNCANGKCQFEHMPPSHSRHEAFYKSPSYCHCNSGFHGKLCDAATENTGGDGGDGDGNDEEKCNEQFDCVNGSTCESMHFDTGAGLKYCLCLAGYSGKGCEVKLPCQLDCGEGGECIFPDYEEDAPHYNREHPTPVCRKKNVSIEYSICPNSVLMCHKRNVCKERFGIPYCECSTVHSDNHGHGGHYPMDHEDYHCEHPRETTCSVLAQNNATLCLNGGTCVDKVQTNGYHLACDCPDGYDGLHCDKVSQVDDENTGLEQQETSPANKLEKDLSPKLTDLQKFEVFGIVTLATSITCLMLYFAIRVHKRSMIEAVGVAEEFNEDIAIDNEIL